MVPIIRSFISAFEVAQAPKCAFKHLLLQSNSLGEDAMEDKKHKLRHIFVIVISVIIFGGFFIMNFLTSPPEIIKSERRVPTKLPIISARTIISGEFTENFERYAADQFPFREHLRTIHAALIFQLYMQSDHHGLYMDANGIGLFQDINQDSYRQLAAKIKNIAAGLNTANIYYAFIPDKSIYSPKNLPGYDARRAESLLKEVLPAEYRFINLTASLNADSFYKTDLHWNQTQILAVLDVLGDAMGFAPNLSQYTEVYAGEFSGVYAGQLALPTQKDNMRYLINPSLSALYLNMATMEMEAGPLYDLQKFSGLDPYDIFLSGIQPLVVLTDDKIDADRILYLFRDSFSSSLAPLLADAYAKIYLIDLRYFDSRTLNRVVDFQPDADVLFLYSSLILNNAEMLLY